MIEQKTLSRQELEKKLQDNSIDKLKEIASEIHTAPRNDENEQIKFILNKETS